MNCPRRMDYCIPDWRMGETVKALQTGYESYAWILQMLDKPWVDGVLFLQAFRIALRIHAGKPINQQLWDNAVDSVMEGYPGIL